MMEIKEAWKNNIFLIKFSISLVILHFLYLPLVDATPVFACFFFLFQTAYVITVICIISSLKRNIIVSCIILITCMGTILLSVQVGCYWEDLNFAFLLNKRKEVISEIKSGTLGKGTREEILKLPRKYHSVSKDNTIQVNRDKGDLFITFDTYQTWLDNYEGFIYCSTNKEPSADLLFYKGATVTFTRKQNNWYFFEHF